MTYYMYFYYAAPTSSTTSAEVWISIAVTIPIIIMFVIAVVIGTVIGRRQDRLNRDPPRNPLDHTTSTHNTAYSMNQRSSNSNQTPPQNVYGARPTGQNAASPYRMSYPQQPPNISYPQQPPNTSYPQQPPDTSYPQQPPATAKPPPALYFSGREAPPPYPG